MKETIDGTAVVVTDTPEPQSQAIEIRSAFDVAPALFAKALERRKKNREALLEWIRGALKRGKVGENPAGCDYGPIHVTSKKKCDRGWRCTIEAHWSKDVLFKQGAEKIVGMLGLRAHWPTLEELNAKLEKDPSMHILLECQLRDKTDAIIAQGFGGRNPSTDYGDLNKSVKMAKKSGLIDATLNAGGLSELFTQDLEDMHERDNPTDTEGDPITVETHCLIGKKHRNEPWARIDEGYLWWVVDNVKDAEHVARAKRELESRHVEPEAKKERRREEAKDRTLSEWARAIAIAKTSDDIVAIRETLPAKFEPSLRAFLTQREDELAGAR